MINPWTVSLTANAGLILRTTDLTLWVDAIHNQPLPGYSVLTPELQDKLFSPDFVDQPDVIAFTHCHPDHYSRLLCIRASETFPKARFILPEDDLPGQLLLQGKDVISPINDRLITFHRLTHEGVQYANVPHYGIMIEDGGERIVILGDCAIQTEELASWLSGLDIDTLIAPFAWVTLPQGLHILRKLLKPNVLLISHLPFQTDDIYGYRNATRHAAEKLRAHMDIRILSEPFQTECL